MSPRLPSTLPDDRSQFSDADREARLVAAMEEYCRAVEQGQPIDRQIMLQRYTDIATELTECLAGMEFIQGAAEQLHEAHPAPPHDMTAGVGDGSGDAPRMLGDFRIVREIGRGGMGIVYEAVQEMLGRRVALKVLPFAALLEDRQRIRFQNEARAAATLDHPNIVHVYSVGVERGIYYYAMQLVAGHSLADVLKALRDAAPGQGDANATAASATPLSRLTQADTRPVLQAGVSTYRSGKRAEDYRTIARLGVQVAEALEHAHSRGILHRDIKPANILLDQRGTALITDFGLARLDGGTELTLTGDIIGTLRYAPPEQALGKQHVMDERVDIYALGATLYEAITLRPIFDGNNREELLRQLTLERPVSPRKIDPFIPRALETIVLKSIEKDAGDRYSSARELADDLNCFLNHQPIAAKPPSRLIRFVKWTQRHPQLVLTTALLLFLCTVALLAGLAVISREQSRTERQRSKSVANLRTALQAVDDMYKDVAENWISQDSALSPLQTDFLGRASATYEAIAAQNRDEPEVSFEVAKAYRRAAQLQMRRNEFESASENYRTSLELLGRELESNPEDAEVRFELALAYADFGSLQGRQGNVVESFQLTEQAVNHLRQVCDLAPDEPQYVDSLISVEQNLAVEMEGKGDIQGAMRRTRDLLARMERIVDAQPNHWQIHLNRLWSVGYLSHLLQDQQEFEAAVDICRDGLKRIRKLEDINWQDDRRVLRHMARVTSQMGRSLKAMERWEEAEGEAAHGTRPAAQIISVRRHSQRISVRQRQGGSLERTNGARSICVLCRGTSGTRRHPPHHRPPPRGSSTTGRIGAHVAQSNHAIPRSAALHDRGWQSGWKTSTNAHPRGSADPGATASTT